MSEEKEAQVTERVGEAVEKDGVIVGNANQGMVFVNPPLDIPRFYANNVETTISSWDVRLIFGEIVEIQESQIITQRIAKVHLSLQQAKILAAVLSESIGRFEKDQGPIKIYGQLKEGAPDSLKE